MRFFVFIALLFVSCNLSDEGLNTLEPPRTDQDIKQDLGNSDSNTVLDLIGANFSPADGARDVETLTKISFSINTPIDEDTLNELSFLIQSKGKVISSSLSYDSATRTLILSPMQPLPLSTRIDVSYTSQIADSQGNKLQPGKWSFTTRSGKWSPTETLTDDFSANVHDPQITINSKGLPTVIWKHDREGATFSNLFSSALVKEAWTTPLRVDNGSQHALGGRITTDGDLQYAAWHERDIGANSQKSVWTNRTSDNNWSSGEKVESTFDLIENISIKSSGPGATFLLWRTLNSNFSKIHIRHIEDGSPSVQITSDGGASDPQLAIDALGNATIGWKKNNKILVRHLSVGGELSAVFVLADSSSHLRLAAGRGGVFAAWLDVQPNLGASIMISKYLNGEWSSPESVHNSQAVPTELAIDMNERGEALITWIENNKVLALSLSELGHSDAEELGTQVGASPDVKIDADGNGFAVWESAFGILVHRYEKGIGWSDSRDIEKGRDPQIFVETKRSWLVWTGGTQIMLERFE